MQSNYSAIESRMQLYFDGLYHCDIGRLRQVLHPDARYVCATDDELVNLGLTEYLPIVDARESPASRGEARQDEIVSIMFAGTRTAFVKAHCAIGPKRFTDFLIFVQDEGRWQIISKVFHYDLV